MRRGTKGSICRPRLSHKCPPLSLYDLNNLPYKTVLKRPDHIPEFQVEIAKNESEITNDKFYLTPRLLT